MKQLTSEAFDHIRNIFEAIKNWKDFLTLKGKDIIKAHDYNDLHKSVQKLDKE